MKVTANKSGKSARTRFMMFSAMIITAGFTTVVGAIIALGRAYTAYGDSVDVDTSGWTHFSSTSTISCKSSVSPMTLTDNTVTNIATAASSSACNSKLALGNYDLKGTVTINLNAFATIAGNANAFFENPGGVMNGYGVESDIYSSNASSPTITNNYSVIIQNVSLHGTTVLNNANTMSRAVMENVITNSSVITNDGSLVIESGNYSGTTINNTGTTEISEGIFSNLTVSGGTLTISGGTFNGTTTIPSNAVVTGGKFTTQPPSSTIPSGKIAKLVDGYYVVMDDDGSGSGESGEDSGEVGGEDWTTISGGIQIPCSSTTGVASLSANTITDVTATSDGSNCYGGFKLMGYDLKSYTASTSTITIDSKAHITINGHKTGATIMPNDDYIPESEIYPPGNGVATIYNSGMVNIQNVIIYGNQALQNNKVANLSNVSIDRSSVVSSGILNIPGGYFNETTFTNTGAMTIDGGIFTISTITGSGGVVINGGTFYDTSYPSSATINGGKFSTKPTNLPSDKTTKYVNGLWEVVDASSSGDGDNGNGDNGEGDNGNGEDTPSSDNLTTDIDDAINDEINQCLTTTCSDPTIEEAKDAKNNGHTITTQLTYSEITLNAEQKAMLEDVIWDYKELVAYSVNIEVIDQTAGKSLGRITELKKNITIALPLPSNTPGVASDYKRTYTTIRLSSSVGKRLPSTLTSDGQLAFNTNRFGIPYVLAYQDTKSANGATSTSGDGSSTSGGLLAPDSGFLSNLTQGEAIQVIIGISLGILAIVSAICTYLIRRLYKAYGIVKKTK